MRRLKLLCSAQTFGFGPHSTLFSIVRELPPEVKCVMLRSERRSVFDALNPEVFPQVITLERERDLARVLEREKPDALLSVMDPLAVLEARHAGIPAFFVDTLFWFWHLPRGVDELAEQVAAALRRGRFPEMLSPHERIALGHLLSRQSYVQHDARLGSRLVDFEPHAHIRLVGALIHIPRSVPAPDRTGGVLVTTSGATIPTVPVERSADHVALVMELVQQLSACCFSQQPWTVLVNPELLAVLASRQCPLARAPVEVRASVSQEQMARLLTHATLVLTPPGLHSIYECAAARVPAVFLPEQSAQYMNAQRLRDYAYPIRGVSLHELEAGDGNGDPDGIGRLYEEYIPRYRRRPEPLVQRMLEDFAELRTEDRRQALATAQRQGVLRMVGSFHGSAQVADDLLREWRVGSSKKPRADPFAPQASCDNSAR